MGERERQEAAASPASNWKKLPQKKSQLNKSVHECVVHKTYMFTCEYVLVSVPVRVSGCVREREKEREREE